MIDFWFCSFLGSIILGKEVNSISSLVTASGVGTLLMILVEIQTDI